MTHPLLGDKSEQVIALASALAELDTYSKVGPDGVCNTISCTGMSCHECPFNSLQDWQRFKAKLKEEHNNVW